MNGKRIERKRRKEKLNPKTIVDKFQESVISWSKYSDSKLRELVAELEIISNTDNRYQIKNQMLKMARKIQAH